ncbi:putative cytosol aminopeptidase [Betaproteobacteria bacterium]|nr:putative cytosol aminopeptidase [Betaproteobacteria bacterium]
MEFTIKTASPDKQHGAILVLPAFSDGPKPTLGALAQVVDDATHGKLAALIGAELDDKAGATLLLHGLDGVKAERVLVLSLGKAEKYGEKAWRDALAAAAKALTATPARDGAFAIDETMLPYGRDLAWGLRQASRILADGAYRFDAPRAKTEKSAARGRGVKKLLFVLAAKVSSTLEAAVREGAAIAEGMALAKDLGNLGANVCTPDHLAESARALGKQFKFGVEVLDRSAIEKLGMGAFLAVARGARQEPRFIVLNYQGGKAKAKPVVLVGKGITFDSGGISLKPGVEMDEMKYDMCGAASVIGAFKTLALLALPLNVVGIVPATENMPGGNATRPGDVITSLSGQTIEILNTDAEGRLILCDALTYAERFKPDCVIDIATLTGACVVALGKIPSGLLANDDELAAELVARGNTSGDRVWQLPLWEDYQDLLKSNFADMANIGGRYGGAITAAAFLSRFARHYKWAHLDIAGTAWVGGEAKGSTGRPIPLLVEFLLGRAARH